MRRIYRSGGGREEEKENGKVENGKVEKSG